MKYSYRNCKIAVQTDNFSHAATVARLEMLGYDPTTAYRFLIQNGGLVSPADAEKIQKLQEISSFVSADYFNINEDLMQCVQHIRWIQDILLRGTKPVYLTKRLAEVSEFSKESVGFEFTQIDFAFLAMKAGEELKSFVQSETRFFELVRTFLPEITEYHQKMEEICDEYDSEYNILAEEEEKLSGELATILEGLEKAPHDELLQHLYEAKNDRFRITCEQIQEKMKDIPSRKDRALRDLERSYCDCKGKMWQIDVDMQMRNSIPFGRKWDPLSWLWDIPENTVQLPEGLLEAFKVCQDVVAANKNTKNKISNAGNRQHLYREIFAFYDSLPEHLKIDAGSMS